MWNPNIIINIYKEAYIILKDKYSFFLDDM